MITAKIVADSVAPSRVRLTTFVLTYPRFIHSEFMTHRMLSRNASSSRAIPTAKFLQAIQDDPAMPISFSQNCKGMQAQNDIENQDEAKKIWLEARDSMMGYAKKLADIGVHKQHANRLLEPFQHITVVASATDWDNFFSLRLHKDAQPEFRALAQAMRASFKVSTPKLLLKQYHLPFVTEDDKLRLHESVRTDENFIKMSVARCARVSYNMHDGSEVTLEKDIELYDRLVGSSPLHASPTEHQAFPHGDTDFRSGNFRGWIQYRKTLTNENFLEFQDSEDLE